MKKYRLLLLIFVLYKCGVFCVKSNKVQLFTSVKFKHPDAYNYDKVRFERGIRKFDFGLVEKNRVTRGILGSKNHLRSGDAHQIAHYFLTGGPLKGHAHFTREINCDSNNTESNVVGMSNPESKNDTDSSINDTDSSINEQNSNGNVSDPITGAQLPQLPPLPPHKPIVQPPNLYKPPKLHPSLNTLIPNPHTPIQHTFLGSILHPRLHPHISALHTIPSALMKAASMPVHGLLQAQSHLHDILQPHGLVGSPNLLGSPNKTSKRAKAKMHSMNNFIYLMGQPPIVGASLNNFDHKAAESNERSSPFPTHPQPTGYIVRYVPHNKTSESLTPISTPQTSDDSPNSEENVTISADNNNQDADKDE
ncbi:uncharacterized protein LOC117603740 isoform X1 [Osmia lignaria lignaria]|uniref:uncharacterized protein LOC117603740 isoform X1 n=1 Tax=Osmia lignaria lignaria TaxID=1437193 RepID=UPI00402B8E72